MGLWRQQLRPSTRVHGIIREGGTAANIIPERAVAWFMLRSDDRRTTRRSRPGSREMCEAAALATGTTVEVTYSGGATTMRNNGVLAERFRANMAAYGIEDQGDDPSAGSTDMANVSGSARRSIPSSPSATRACPATPSCSATRPPSPRADETTLLAATLVAQTAYELFADPALVEAAWREFRARLTADGRGTAAPG